MYAQRPCRYYKYFEFAIRHHIKQNSKVHISEDNFFNYVSFRYASEKTMVFEISEINQRFAKKVDFRA